MITVAIAPPLPPPPVLLLDESLPASCGGIVTRGLRMARSSRIRLLDLMDSDVLRMVDERDLKLRGETGGIDPSDSKSLGTISMPVGGLPVGVSSSAVANDETESLERESGEGGRSRFGSSSPPRLALREPRVPRGPTCLRDTTPLEPSSKRCFIDCRGDSMRRRDMRPDEDEDDDDDEDGVEEEADADGIV